MNREWNIDTLRSIPGGRLQDRLHKLGEVKNECLDIYCQCESLRTKTRSKTRRRNTSVRSPAPPKDVSSAPNGNQLESGKNHKTADEGMRAGSRTTLHLWGTDSTRLHYTNYTTTNCTLNAHNKVHTVYSSVHFQLSGLPGTHSHPAKWPDTTVFRST